jgi:parallel beta-helix repeat protein
MSVMLNVNSPTGIRPEVAQASSPPSGGIVWNQTYGTENYEAVNFMIQTDDEGFALVGNTAPSLLNASYDAWLVKTDANGNMQWNQTYGGTSRDYGCCVIQTIDGGYAIVGYTNSSGTFDAWLIKTDSGGNSQWSKTYGGSGSDNAYRVIQTSDGGYVIGGTTSSLGAGANDFWLIRVDSSGNEQWNKTHGGSGSDSLNSMVQADDNGYALVGYTSSFGAGGGDIFLVKTDVGGNMQWSETYGGNESDSGYSVIQTVDGGYAVAGYTGPFASSDVFLVKTDTSGHLQWNLTYGGTSIDVGNSIIQNSYGEYIVVGLTNSSALGMGDAFLIKIDTGGNVVASRRYGGPEIDNGRSVVQTSDGGYVFAGSTVFGFDDADSWLVKISDIAPITWVVDDDGPADSSSIQQAINAAQSGDTILVLSGIYYENLVVDKAVSLLGQGANQTIIDGTFSGNVITIASENVIVDGFTIEHGEIIDPQNYNDYGAGVAALNSHCTISNNIIKDCNYGISFPNYATIENNEIISSTHQGILVEFSGNNVITDNNVTSIGLYFTSGNVLRNNQVTDYFAVYASGSDVDTSNTLKGNPFIFYKTRQILLSPVMLV